jgi:transcriptional antiterminator NusG
MSLTITGENSTTDVHAGATAKWPFKVTADESQFMVKVAVTTGPDASAPEWEDICINDSTGSIWNNDYSKPEFKVEKTGSAPKDLVLMASCPRGARYGDTVSIIVEVSSAGQSQSIEFKARAVQSIMILKTQIDQEKSVVDSLFAKANEGEKDIYAVLSPSNLRGYVFVEGMNTDRMREKTRDIRKARAFVNGDSKGETSIEEIGPYLTPISTVVGMVEGDIVELVSGPFKGEKARVQKIDETKEEITVELVEAMVPIPVTVKGDSVRVIEKEK